MTTMTPTMTTPTADQTTHALRALQHLLSQTEHWNADTLDAVAATLAQAGFPVLPPGQDGLPDGPSAAPPQAPLIHLNGSSQTRLIDQLTNVHEAADALLAALAEATPHGRDYYLLGNDAFTRAQDQHRARVRKANAVLEETASIRLQIVTASERAGRAGP